MPYAQVILDRFGLIDYCTIIGIFCCVECEFVASLRSFFVNRMVAARPSLSNDTSTRGAKAFGDE